MNDRRSETASEESLLDHVLEIFTEALTTIVPDSFDLNVERDEGAPSGGTIVRLDPAQSACASLTAYIPDTGDEIELVVGRDTLIEVGKSSRWRPLRTPSFEQELHAILSVVLEGRITEELWTKDGRVIRSKGIVRLAHKTLTFSSDHGGYFVWHPERIEVNYKPYPAARV